MAVRQSPTGASSSCGNKYTARGKPWGDTLVVRLLVVPPPFLAPCLVEEDVFSSECRAVECVEGKRMERGGLSLTGFD